ncbi:MAG TPA: antitoxin [Actinocrinis sp.]|jgi:hypothetical protein|uniref:antitoxin n=1 Tax=Actinocrinis sp. TaxID=1920516 RepID=UPI002DDD6422|nr:antitoxin [Actinocrinis sp.]HEV3169892.1 antitoxin [Actinocrinis sp.]
MGILDKLRQHKDDAAVQNEATKGIDQAGQMLDDKTDNKYTGQINTGVGKAEEMMGLKPQDDAQQPDPNAAPPADPNQPTDGSQDSQDQPPAGW